MSDSTTDSKKGLSYFIHQAQTRIISKKGIATLAMLIVLSGLIYASTKPAANTDQLTYVVEKETLQDSVIASGNIQAGAQTTVFSPSTGIIDELYVQNNQIVAEGQNIMKIRSTATEQEKATALSSYTAALSALKTAEQTVSGSGGTLETARTAVLNAQAAVTLMEKIRSETNINPTTKKEYTQAEIDALYSALNAARTQFSTAEKQFNNRNLPLQSAQAAFKAAELEYNATQDITVTAPTSGTVANLKKTRGESVSNGRSGQTQNKSVAEPQATELLTIADLSNLSIEIRINEGDIAQLSEGQKANITIDGIPGETFKGRVERIDTIGSNVQGVITYNAYVLLEDRDSRIRPQMTADVSIVLIEKQDVIAVPNSAVITEDNGSFVMIKRGNSFQRVAVETGIKGATKTEITNGLAPGDILLADATKE